MQNKRKDETMMHVGRKAGVWDAKVVRKRTKVQIVECRHESHQQTNQDYENASKKKKR